MINQISASALRQDTGEGDDFTLVRPVCWVTVDDVTLYIRRINRNHVKVTAYRNGHEVGNPFDRLEVRI